LSTCPYTEEEVLEILKYELYQGLSWYSEHFRRRMVDRNFSHSDLDFLIQTGELIWPPEFNPETGDWKFKISGKDLEGADAVVVVAISPDKSVSFITVMDS
jgi:hypothetical protein